MKEIYLHNFTQTGKESGFSLNCHIIQVVKECGVELDCPCNDCGDCGTYIKSVEPAPAQKQQLDNSQLQSSIVGVLKYVQKLEAKIDSLQTELNDVKCLRESQG